MMKSARFQRIVFVVTLFVTTTATQTGQAAGFWDWLWGRSPYYRSQAPPAYRAPNGYWTHSPWATGATYPAAAAPAGVYPAPTYPSVTIPPQGQAAATYIPNTYAPTTIAPTTATPSIVPTSSFQGTCDPCAQITARPMATAAPGACCQPAAQYAQPLTQYVQPRRYLFRPRPIYRSSWFRVPVTRYRAVPVANPLAMGTVSQLQPCNTYTWQHRRLPVSSYRPFHSYYAQPAQVAVPSFFSQQSAAGCGTCAPSTGTGGTALPYYSTPATSPLAPSPITPAPDSNSNEPANQQPTLRPGEARPQSFNAPIGSGVGNLTGNVPQRRPAPSRPNSKVVPIPDPQPLSEPARSRIEAPPLLGPRDHTASYQPAAWSVTPIVWNAEQAAASSLQQPAQAPTAVAPQEVWDDQGWESIAP